MQNKNFSYKDLPQCSVTLHKDQFPNIKQRFKTSLINTQRSFPNLKYTQNKPIFFMQDKNNILYNFAQNSHIISKKGKSQSVMMIKQQQLSNMQFEDQRLISTNKQTLESEYSPNKIQKIQKDSQNSIQVNNINIMSKINNNDNNNSNIKNNNNNNNNNNCYNIQDINNKVQNKDCDVNIKDSQNNYNNFQSSIYLKGSDSQLRLSQNSNRINAYKKLQAYKLGDEKQYQLSLEYLNSAKQSTQAQENQIDIIDTQEIMDEIKNSKIKIDNSQQQFGGTFSLRKTRSNLDKFSTNRQEVLELSEWIDLMLVDIKQKQSKMSMKEFADNIQLIYATSLNELIRQCKMECTERGDLLERIWKYYIELIDQIMQKYHQSRKQNEQDSLDEVTRLHQSYGQMIELLKQETLQLKKQMFSNSEMIGNVKQSNQFLKTKLLQSTNELKQLQIQIDDLTTENQNLLQDMINVRSQGINISQQQNNNNNYINIIQTPLKETQKQQQGSIVQHILQFKHSLLMKEVPEVDAPHSSSVQVFDALMKRDIQLRTDIDKIQDNQQPIILSPGKKSTIIFEEGMDISNVETQTDPMTFSDSPIINQIIYDLWNNKTNIDDGKSDDIIFQDSIKFIQVNKHLSQEEKKNLISTIKQSIQNVYKLKQ